MPLDPNYVGKKYSPGDSYLVGREKLREFATAIGDHNPAYHDVAAAQRLGYRDVVAPPTFGFVMTMQALTRAMFDPELGLDYSRVVHGEQTFDVRRPIVAGDEVLVDASIAAINSTGRNEFLTVAADIHSVDGELLVATRSVVVSRGTGIGAKAGAADRSNVVQRTIDEVPVPTPDDVVSQADFTVTRTTLVMYAGASGDFNPIHWNSRIATSVGLPDVIAHGMLTMALAGRAVTDMVGDPGLLQQYAVRFIHPVVVPDDDAGTSIQVTVARAQPEPATDSLARLDISALCDGAEVLGQATALVRLP